MAFDTVIHTGIKIKLLYAGIGSLLYFPAYVRNCPDPVLLNDKPIHCLMYADDIILLSSIAESLQAKLDILDSYCNDWCLTVRERPFNLKGGLWFFF